jgi:hypothetical protein
MPECRDTTGTMLRRIERDVPDGTDIVIVQPGNGQCFFGTLQQRAANVEEMARRLRALSIVPTRSASGLLLLIPQERRYSGHAGTHTSCHVWTAPAVQGKRI